MSITYKNPLIGLYGALTEIQAYSYPGQETFWDFAIIDQFGNRLTDRTSSSQMAGLKIGDVIALRPGVGTGFSNIIPVADLKL